MTVLYQWKKPRKNKGGLREELLWNLPCYWPMMSSACLQKPVQLAVALHWAQQLELKNYPFSLCLALPFPFPFPLIAVWESSVSTTRATCATSRMSLFTVYCSTIYVKLVNYYLLCRAQGSWSDVSVLLAIFLHPFSLSLSLSPALSLSLPLLYHLIKT